MKFYKALSLGFYLLAWFERASRDGKITQSEIVQAISGAASTIGLNIQIDTPVFQPHQEDIYGDMPQVPDIDSDKI